MAQGLPCASALLRSLTLRLAPPAAELDSRSWDELSGIIAGALAAQSAAVRLQLGVFLLALRWLPLVRFGARFERLPAAEQDRILVWLENNPLLLLRTGFWGLKTLVFMGYYGNVRIWPRVAYAPQREGNRMLHV